MNATDVLVQEHRVIERVLRCLTAAVNQVLEGGELDGASIRQMVKFFREFADRCHHGKEEARLFPLLEQRGIGCERGPIGVMLSEHDTGRRHVLAMVENLPAAERGEARAKAQFLEHAQEYVQLLSEHIQKEDGCLFPMANNVLSAADQQALMATFEQVEREEMGAGAHERLHALADELCERWKVPTSEGVCAHHCSGHS